MDNIKVSIIIPVYNTEKYLKQCLDSVINQTLKEIEIICVNDGSTDGSPQILKQYAEKDKRIKIINKRNAGPGAARNIAMKHAKGEYIGFVDSDDWIDKYMYEKLYQNAKLYNSDLVMCPIQLYNNSNIKLKHNLAYFDLSCFNDGFDNCVFDSKQTKNFLFNISVTTFNKIYRKEFIESIDAKFPEGLIFEDNEFFYQNYLRASRISLIRDFLYFYRVNRTDSIMSSPDKRFFDVIKIENQTIKHFLSLPNSQDYKMDLINIKIFRIIHRYFEVDKIYRKEFFELIKKDFEEMHLKKDEINNLNSSNKDHYQNVLKSNSNKEFELLEESELKELKIQKKNLNETIEVKPKISIIVPIFNAQNYIKKALESIVNQNIGLEHLEIIMVDDCSTDQSGKIIDEYSDKYNNFKAIHLPENSGNVGKPRNIGLQNATGEYIMFLDADDFYAKDACKTLYDKIVESKVDLVFCNFNLYYPNGTLKKSYLPTFGDSYEIKVETIDDNPLILDIYRIWTLILKRDFILDKGLKFAEDIISEDRLFLLECFFEAKGIIYLQKYFGINYRLGYPSKDASLSNATNKKALLDRIKGYTKGLDLLRSYGKEKYLPYAYNVREFWTDRFIKSDLSSSEKKEILKKIVFLFKEYERFEVKPYKSYLPPLFNHITNERFDEAVLLADVLKDFINKQEKLEKQRDELREKLKKERINVDKFKKLSNNIERLKKQNTDLKRLVNSYRSRKVVRITDNVLQFFKSFRLKNPNKNASLKLKGNTDRTKKIEDNKFSQFLYEQKEIEKLEKQKICLIKLLKLYQARKVVRTADTILKSCNDLKISLKKNFNQNDNYNENLFAGSKNKKVDEPGNLKGLKESYTFQNKIERLKNENKILENLVNSYRSRKVVRTAEAILKIYHLPKLFISNLNKRSDASQEDIVSTRSKCADPKLSEMKSKFVNFKQSKTGPQKIKDIKVAVIFDEFSYNSFKYEFNAIPIEPFNWLEIFERENPDLFLCESSWEGIDSTRKPWKDKIYLKASAETENRKILFDILKYCNGHGIPTIFWNKEDPTDFDIFYDTALKFDHIFTTAEECVSKYEEYGHRSVHCLMFAGQPKLFNPIEIQERSKDVIFPGSWYNRHTQRSKEMIEIFDNILDSGYNLKIYDRHFNRVDEQFKFPDKYHDYLNPSIPFDQIEEVYKESEYSLNINTITDSNSMFSRRVFELMLCNTLVLSNYSKGMIRLFGDNVVVVGKDKIELSNSHEKRLKNLYDVLGNHIYYNRFKQMLDDINYKYLPYDENVTVYYVLSNLNELEDVFKHFASIDYNFKELAIFLSEEIPYHVIDGYSKKLSDVEVSFYPLEPTLNLKEVISDTSTHFIFADFGLKNDFIKKAILHYSYIDKGVGITVGDSFKFSKSTDTLNILFHSDLFEYVFKTISENLPNIEFPVYTIQI